MVEMTDRKTIIWVSEGVWKWLQSQKEIGESFDRLLIRLLDLEIDSEKAANSSRTEVNEE